MSERVIICGSHHDRNRRPEPMIDPSTVALLIAGVLAVWIATDKHKPKR